MSKNIGINISGYINKVLGLGTAVRANINAIKSAKIPFVVNDFNLIMPETTREINFHQIISEENPFEINLIQINPDNLSNTLKTVSPNYFKNKYNIAFWAWELENFPEEFITYFDLFNEIWVPSNFCAEAIAKVSPCPVIKIMHSIEIKDTPYKRKDFALPDNKFIFMTMFDYHSSIKRKNPIATIDAYEKAFGLNDHKTLLIIKTSISKEFPEDKKLITDRIIDNKSIILIEEIFENEKLYSLINCCDCFVSLHRSEGFGLTMAEAMYLGKPVIATAYSANIEFMNINNYFPVKYNLIKTGNEYYFSSDKDFWADADIDDASQQMSIVFNNRELALSIAQNGQNYVKEFLSPKAIGDKIKHRVEIIQNNLMMINSTNEETKEKILLRQENKSLKEKLDKIRSLKCVQLKIKFKNFQNKISGKNKKYFWED
ncbi:glycosyltransferase [Chryseobacterium gambrini]|uniref:Glycosyltransferase n=1 Tax=Chryseobacterium gambrini TaxID=373672 RepID=A0AAJ1R424_9FLAO|nr:MULTISPECIES: glycosyltransferase [Chryseobacterium]MDN4012872.1 glycosyltransferase [Chryseobacterium gambrini]MDN4030619.1 glycosyltransferase [Chryseobacterium gambrini]QWA36589.1 glycosyltransferase [Chryseobacterium sp. ZHDP1]